MTSFQIHTTAIILGKENLISLSRYFSNYRKFQIQGIILIFKFSCTPSLIYIEKFQYECLYLPSVIFGCSVDKFDWSHWNSITSRVLSENSTYKVAILSFVLSKLLLYEKLITVLVLIDENLLIRYLSEGILGCRIIN